MKQLFEMRPLNGLQGDPGLWMFFPKTGDAILLDLGSTDHLPPKELLRLTHVFVSHTHMDHFIGFDRLLRAIISHERVMRMVGPPGFIRNVQGRLQSYLWNLLPPGQLTFEVTELDAGGNLRHATLRNNDFEAVYTDPPAPPTLPKADPPLPERPTALLAILPDRTRVEGVLLDHGTPSLGFLVQAPMRYHVDETVLQQMGLSPGPWIRDLQIALQNNDTHAKITTADQTFEAGTLGDKLLTGSSPRLLAYVTDILFSRANVERVRATMTGADTFVCEAVFMDADRVEATAKRHLTTRQAAMLASLIKARHTRVFHVSNLYTRQIPDVLSEFHGFLKQYQALDQAALEAAIAEEIARENSPS